jgi:hypothetical protein
VLLKEAAEEPPLRHPLAVVAALPLQRLRVVAVGAVEPSPRRPRAIVATAVAP